MAQKTTKKKKVAQNAKAAKDTKDAKATKAPASATPATPATKAPDAKAPAKASNPTAGSSAFNPQTVKHRAMLISTEEKVNSLKEKIFRSKAQLMLLQEKLLHGVISTAKLKLIHDNRMGGAFYLESAAYSIDGRPVYSRSDRNGSLNSKKAKTVTLFQESISPGPHRITVVLNFRGNGYGMFSYLKGYKFRLRSSYPFRAQEGKLLEIRVVPYEKGWTVPMDKRAALKYEVKVRKLYSKTKKLQTAAKQK